MKWNLMLSVALISGTAAILGGCGQADREISQQKQGIDVQKSEQYKLIDERAESLKNETDFNAQKADKALEQMKKQDGVDKSLIADKQHFIKKRADLDKKNIDMQVEAGKKQVDWNADVVKTQLDESAALQKHQNK